MKTLLPTSEMERAYLARDPSYGGLFVLGVRSTGIFCRPTCPARKPFPDNVEYFPTATEAMASGYRPCKRCRPLAWDDEPHWAAELVAEIERDPARRITEKDLSARGIDPTTVRRHFLRRYGMTFQAFARARRLSGVLPTIRKGKSLDDAVFESGYESHSGFREAFAKAFGDAPGRSRDRETVLVSWFRSPLGPLVAGATDGGICMLEFSDPGALEERFAHAARDFGAVVVPGANAHLTSLGDELEHYFAGALRAFSVPLVLRGTPFQERVWRQLLSIPYGETRSYKEIAGAIGDAKAVRAVGRANGLNRIAIVIPCHRVVQADGTLGGYGGGVHRKRYLLDLESAGDPRAEVAKTT